MQREKLYNLQWFTIAIVALFIFKMNKTLSDQISMLPNKDCFGKRRIHFCYVIFHICSL